MCQNDRRRIEVVAREGYDRRPAVARPMTPTDDPLAAATAAFAEGRLADAVADVDRLLDGPAYVPGAYLLRSKCFARGGGNDPLIALQNAEAEAVLNPDLPGLVEHLATLKQKLDPARGPLAPAQRQWATALDAKLVNHFEFCSHKHTYRSIPLIKNAFDLVLYPKLLWQTKPRTVIEIGSFFGGSAVWMADLTGGFGLDTHIYSVDINKVWTARHERVTFLQGSGRELDGVFSDDFLATLPRPWLVIEDADHSFETTTAVLEFFHDRLRPGEYIVVEDTMSSPPALTGLRQFLDAHLDDYEVDADYCDHFGQNVTWCVNGFLRRR